MIVLLDGNPKGDGLCRSLSDALLEGISLGGATAVRLDTCDRRLRRCQICGTGWGSCRTEHRCSFGDDGFTAMQDLIHEAAGYILVTPVYWHEMAEGLKSFLDRLRRCEALHPSPLQGRGALLLASAGGSGNGILPCLEQMERFCRHVGLTVYDRLGANRWNADWMRKAAREAARSFARFVLDPLSPGPGR